MLVAIFFHRAPPFILIDNQWCWPSRAPFEGVSLYVLTGSQSQHRKGEYRQANHPSNLHISGVYIQWFYIHTLKKNTCCLFILPGEANSCFCCSGSSPQTEARVYLLANHPGGAQWKSWSVAAFVLSFLFHVCLSEMAKPFRGLTVLHLDFEVFFLVCFHFVFQHWYENDL